MKAGSLKKDAFRHGEAKGCCLARQISAGQSAGKYPAGTGAAGIRAVENRHTGQGCLL